MVTMGSCWSSMWGATGTFHSVISTCAYFLSFHLQPIASLPTFFAQTFTTLHGAFWTQRSGQLTLSTQVLPRDVYTHNDVVIPESSQPTDCLELLPLYFQLLSIAQKGNLELITTSTLLFFHTPSHSLLVPKWAQSPIEQLVPSAKTHYPEEVHQTDGQTDAGCSTNTSTRPSVGRKRKSSSATIGSSKALKLGNKRGKDNDDDNPNPRDPTYHEDIDDHPDDEPEKYFACHFFKLNPREYHRCGSKQLKTLDNLKQHIKRTHYTAGLHCCCCWAEFGDNHQALRTHAIGGCVEQQGPDTLFEEDLRLLQTDRGSDPEAKWYQIWSQICEGHEEPESPYIALNGVEEIGGLIEREYRSRLRRILHAFHAESRINTELNVEDFIARLDNDGDASFSVSTLFATRHRRNFRPRNAVQSTDIIQDEVDQEDHNDDGGYAVGQNAPPLEMEAQPLYQHDDDPVSPSDVLFAPESQEESYEDMLGPPMF